MNPTRIRRVAACVAVLFAAAMLPSPADEPAGIRVIEYGVGTGIEDHDLQGRGERFAESTRVWFWTRVVGGAAGDRIRHVWIKDGKEVSIGLAIGGPHWRTFTSKTLHPGSAGAWAVEARDAEDRVLARQEFLCTAGPTG